MGSQTAFRGRRKHGGGHYVIIKDVTSQVREEQRRLVSNRIQDIHQTGRALAHDFSNLLIGAQAQLARIKVTSSKAQTDEAIDGIDQALNRARSMLEQLGAGSQFGTPRLSPQDLARLAAEAVAICQGLARDADVELILDAKGSWPVEADASQLSRVFINLIKNAIRASAAGDQVRIDLLRPGTGILARIRDQGSGMTPEELKMSFEPGFSTKGEGKGGLGLAVSYLMIDAHGGHLDLAPNPDGRGLCASLWLPERRDATARYQELAGKSVILAARDEVMRIDLARQLESAGSTVAEVETWEEIEALLGEMTGWQVLLLDNALASQQGRQKLPPELTVQYLDPAQ